MTQPADLAATVATVAEGAAAVVDRLAAGLPTDRPGRDRLCEELHALIYAAARLQGTLAAVDGPAVREWRFVEVSGPTPRATPGADPRTDHT